MPHVPGHEGNPPPPEGRVVRTSFLEDLQNDIQQTFKGNPIFEAIGAVTEAAEGSPAGMLGVLMPSPGGAAASAPGLAARSSRGVSSGRAMEEVLRNPQFRRRVFRELGTEGAGRVRKYIGAGKGKEEAFKLAQKELRAKRLMDAVDVFEQAGRLTFGGFGRGQLNPMEALVNMGLSTGAATGETVRRREQVDEELNYVNRLLGLPENP